MDCPFFVVVGVVATESGKLNYGKGQGGSAEKIWRDAIVSSDLGHLQECPLDIGSTPRAPQARLKATNRLQLPTELKGRHRHRLIGSYVPKERQGQLLAP